MRVLLEAVLVLPGILRDRHVPLAGIFSIFASAALISVVLVLLIRPRKDMETNS